MSEALELVCVGGGNMASAILLGASERGVFDSARVGVVDPNEEKRESFASAGFRVGASLGEFAESIGERTQVMLAVKPQALAGASEQLRAVLADVAAYGQAEPEARLVLGRAAVAEELPSR